MNTDATAMIRSYSNKLSKLTCRESNFLRIVPWRNVSHLAINWPLCRSLWKYLYWMSRGSTAAKFTATIISDCERTHFGRPLPGEEICYPTFCRWIVLIRHWSTEGVTNFLFIRWVIQTKCKLPQKSPLRYSGSYLHTTLPLSVISVTLQGDPFIAQFRGIPNCRRGENPHETADIEAICICK